LLDIL